MDRSTSLIRIEMDGSWSAHDLGQMLVDLVDLYDLRLFLELLREDQRDWEHFYEEMIHFPSFRRAWRRRFMAFPLPGWSPGLCGAMLPTLDEVQLSRLGQLFEPQERLELRRIRYASPGISDLAGIGTVIGHIKDFIIKLIDRRDSRRQRELDEERSALENDRIRLENARNFVALARDLGYSDTDVRSLVAYVDRKQDRFVALIDEHKIQAVSTPDAANSEKL